MNMKNKNKIFADKKVKLCEKTYPLDSGYDLKSISEPIIVGEKIIGEYYKSIQYIEYDTGIKIDTLQRKSEKQICAFVFPRSSISSKTNLVLANSVGVIDPLYRDSIKVRFRYIFQPNDFKLINDEVVGKINQDKIYKIGDRIAQIIFVENLDHEIDYVEQLIETGRGGFGSTGD
jgi:dUTPase